MRNSLSRRTALTEVELKEARVRHAQRAADPLARATDAVSDRIVELLAARYDQTGRSRPRRGVDAAVRPAFSKAASTVLRRIGLDPFRVPALRPVRLHLEEHAASICAPKPRCGSCMLVSFCATGVRRLSSNRLTSPTVLDLFGGAGGLGYGFRQARFRVGLAVELDREAAQSYRLNNPGVPVLEADVADLTSADVLGYMGSAPTVICAGPPCQSYSLAGTRADDDPRHHLFEFVLALSRKLRPKALVIENVPGIGRAIGDGSFRETLVREIGKQFGTEVMTMDAREHGVPQSRKRLFFVGRAKATEPFGAPPPSHSFDGSGRRKATPTVLDVLRRLPRRRHGSSNDVHVREDGVVVRNLATMLHSERVLRKIAAIRPGEGPISYRRTRPDYARTVVAGHRALAVHPTQHRTLSVREAASLQGFPEHYAFMGFRANTPLQVANAVPPPVARALALHIRRRLSDTSVDGNG